MLRTFKEFEIISEQEAYEQILNGRFVCAIDKGEKISESHYMELLSKIGVNGTQEN